MGRWYVTAGARTVQRDEAAFRPLSVAAAAAAFAQIRRRSPHERLSQTPATQERKSQAGAKVAPSK